MGRDCGERPHLLILFPLENNIHHFDLILLPGFTLRRGGLMVSALVSGSSGPGSSPSRGHCVVFLTLTVPLSTQVYKWVPAILMLGVTLRWTSIPSRGE